MPGATQKVLLHFSKIKEIILLVHVTNIVITVVSKDPFLSLLGLQGKEREVLATYELRLFFKVKDLHFHFCSPLALIMF